MTFFFGRYQTTLGIEHEPVLNQVAAKAKKHNGWLLIEAFADARGGPEKNKILTEERAKIVEDAIRGKLENSQLQMVRVAYGSKYAYRGERLPRGRSRIVTVSFVTHKAARAVNAALKAARGAMADDAAVDPELVGFAAASGSSTDSNEQASGTSASVTNNPTTTTRASAAQVVRINDPVATTWPSQLRLQWQAVPAAPVTWNRLVWAGPSESGESPGLYRSAAGSSAAPLGFGLEYNWGRLATGLRWRQHMKAEGVASFEGSPTHEQRTTTAATGYGTWLDWYVLRSGNARGPVSSLGFGFDIDWSTVTVTDRYKDERVPTAALSQEDEVTSSLGVSSLRGSWRWDYPLGAWFVGTGVTVQVPFAEFSRAIKSSGDGERWSTTIGHRKAAGAEVVLGAGRHL